MDRLLRKMLRALKMEKNDDPKIIVMDRAQFDALLGYAQIGASECGSDYLGVDLKHIEKHVRRFNPHYAHELIAAKGAAERRALEARKAAERRELEALQRAERFVAVHTGSMVYMQNGERFRPVLCLGKDLQRKGSIWLRDSAGLELALHVDELRAELPEDFRLHRPRDGSEPYYGHYKDIPPTPQGPYPQYDRNSPYFLGP